MIAAIIKNPMIKKEGSNTLIDMYGRISSQKDFVIEEMDDDRDGLARNRNPRVYKNTMSL